MSRLHYLIILLLSAMLSPLAISCVSDEEFPTPVGARVSFSADTLDFDTIITHTESPTAQFSIYNKNSKGISITSVRFEGSDKDAFLANVDGISIKSGTPVSIDCRGKDSLIAFVQFNPQIHDNDLPVLAEARLIFTLANGISQSVTVKGYSQDVVVMRGKTISSDTTFAATRPIAIYDSLYIREGATLTLAPGTTLLFAPTAGVRVDGTLIAEGTLEKPIVFRGNRYDNMFVNQNHDNIDNQWQGITFKSSSYGNRLNYCDIHACNYGIECDSSDITRLKLKLENSIVHNATHNILLLKNCHTFIGNTQLTNAGWNCVTVYGGDNTFVHCTLGSFSPFTAFRGNALVFFNEMNEQPCPVKRLEFYNSIITGYTNDEVYAHFSGDDGVEMNYAFYNNLLDTPEITDNPQVLGNIWETKDMEVKGKDNFKGFSTTHLIYDFGLVAESPARGIADSNITKQYYPLDRLGRSRLTASGSDAGCYQYVEEQPKE